MLASALSFAAMGAASHLAGERCDWHLVAFARSSLAFLFTLSLSLSAGVRLALLRPAILWMRSFAGSVGVLFAFYALAALGIALVVAPSAWLMLHNPLRRDAPLHTTS